MLNKTQEQISGKFCNMLLQLYLLCCHLFTPYYQSTLFKVLKFRSSMVKILEITDTMVKILKINMLWSKF
jgi:hypothetical protein